MIATFLIGRLRLSRSFIIEDERGRSDRLKMPSGNDEFWERLKKQLSAAGRITLTETLLPRPNNLGFTKSEVKKVAGFIVDVCDGDPEKATAYAERFARTTDDRLFGRAVLVAVAKKLTA